MMYYRFVTLLLLDTALVNSWRFFPDDSQWTAHMAFVAGTLALYPFFIALSQALGWRAGRFAVVAMCWHGMVQAMEIRDVLQDENTVPPNVEIVIYLTGLAVITAGRQWIGDKTTHHKNQ